MSASTKTSSAHVPQTVVAGEFLTKQELAERLKVTVRTVENWQTAGLLPHLKISNAIRFHWPDVVEHLKTKFTVQSSGAVRARWGARKENSESPKAESENSQGTPHPACGHLLPSAEKASKRQGGGR